jgi:hypothetical protein
MISVLVLTIDLDFREKAREESKLQLSDPDTAGKADVPRAAEQ